jgi:hypothetical protein
MDITGCMFELCWIYIHGPPAECSGDPEFDNSSFRPYLERHDIIYKPRPARRHNKVGLVESGHSSNKLLARRLSQDLDNASKVLVRRPSFTEIIAHATYLRKILYGSRLLSSFEQSRGYQPSIMGLTSCFITPELIQAHEEQIARRALVRLLRSKDSSLLDHSVLAPGTPVYFFTRTGKRTRWDTGFFAHALPEYVGIRRNPGSRGAVLKIAYEDLRLQPNSSLLQQLDALELVIPEVTSAPPDDADPITAESDNALHTEAVIQQSLLTSPHIVENPTKDVGDINISSGCVLNHHHSEMDLESTEQAILKQLHDTIGDADASLRELEWVPSWLLDKAVNAEKSNYLKACEPVHIRDIPPHF